MLKSRRMSITPAANHILVLLCAGIMAPTPSTRDRIAKGAVVPSNNIRRPSDSVISTRCADSGEPGAVGSPDFYGKDGGEAIP